MIQPKSMNGDIKYPHNVCKAEWFSRSSWNGDVGDGLYHKCLFFVRVFISSLYLMWDCPCVWIKNGMSYNLITYMGKRSFRIGVTLSHNSMYARKDESSHKKKGNLWNGRAEMSLSPYSCELLSVHFHRQSWTVGVDWRQSRYASNIVCTLVWLHVAKNVSILERVFRWTHVHSWKGVNPPLLFLSLSRADHCRVVSCYKGALKWV